MVVFHFGHNLADGIMTHNEPEEEALVDITSLIQECASSLSFSNPILCNEESFSLHDSMAALELMDRKMDCCELSASLIHPNNDADVIIPPRSIPTGLEDEVAPLPWNELTIKDAAAIALEILPLLESLLRGTSVAESTYTCLYAHNAVLSEMKERLLTHKFGNLGVSVSPHDTNIAQFLVYAATLAMVEISDVVRSIVLHADIYEEEDFSVNTFGLQFFPDADGPETIKTLQEALDRISKFEEEKQTIDDVVILRYIMEFELSFLKACSSLAKLSATPALQVTLTAQEAARAGVDALSKLLSVLEGQPAAEVQPQILSKCFDPYVYRPLVGSAPVRKVAFLTPSESLPILSKILSEIDWAVCDLLLSGSSLLQIRRMLNHVSLSSVNILSRSLIVLNLYFDDKLLGEHSLGSLIGSEMTQMMGLPNALLESTYGQAFLSRTAKPMYDALKLLVFNRNRQRSYMEAIMFYDWSSLQQEAHIVDVNHRKDFGSDMPPYFTHYALYVTAWLMDHHVALGIELGLFCGHHDLAVAYWYRDFLLSSLLSTLSSIRAAKKMSLETSHAYAAAGDDLQNDMEVMIVGFKRTLCRGIVRFIASLTQAKLLHPVAYEFTSLEQRFQKQFEPFQLIASPPALSYEDFKAGSDFQYVAQADLLSSTSDCFKKSKSMLDNISTHIGSIERKYSPLDADEIRALTKVCVGNSVFLMRLVQQSCGNGTSSGKVTLDFSVHSQFCTIKIV